MVAWQTYLKRIPPMNIVSFNQQPSLMTRLGKPGASQTQQHSKFTFAVPQFGRSDQFQRNHYIPTPEHPAIPVDEFEDDELDPHNPQDRELLIEAILDDVEEAPDLHRRLTNIRNEHPPVRRFSEQQPEQFIEALRNIAVTYAEHGLQAANQSVGQLIRQANNS